MKWHFIPTEYIYSASRFSGVCRDTLMAVVILCTIFGIINRYLIRIFRWLFNSIHLNFCLHLKHNRFVLNEFFQIYFTNSGSVTKRKAYPCMWIRMWLNGHSFGLLMLLLLWMIKLMREKRKKKDEKRKRNKTNRNSDFVSRMRIISMAMLHVHAHCRMAYSITFA